MLAGRCAAHRLQCCDGATADTSRYQSGSMSGTLFLVQILNGLQLGVLLFLIAAGLTLVFGVMDFINLAHGVQYMLGAYLAVAFYGLVGNFLAALVLALARRAGVRLAARVSGLPPSLRSRPPRSGDRHVRHHSVPQSRGEGGLGRRAIDAAGAGILHRLGRADERPALSGLASGHHRLRPRRRRRTLCSGDLHAHRHAGARRRHQRAAWSRRSASISSGCS